MLTPGLIRSLPNLPAPVLTVYLETNIVKAGGREITPPYLARLNALVRKAAHTVPAEEHALFHAQAERVDAYLRSQLLQQPGLVIFAGSDVWEAVPLPIPPEDEVFWGKLALAQLFWLVDENKPYGLVVVGRKRAQFFLCWLGEMLELEEKKFRMEESRKKEMGPVSRPGVRMSRGVDRDVYEHHRDAEYRLFNRDLAERIRRWRAVEPLNAIFLAGESEVVRDIRDNLPQALREEVILVEEDLGWMTRAQLQERVEPMVARHERERETELINVLLGSDRGVTIGIDETLGQLQQGRIRRLAVVKGLDSDLRQCTGCGRADRAADPVCAICGGERTPVTLRVILPGLARQHQVSLEVVSGEAARRLHEAGGMGGWLREVEKKEYGSATPAHA